MNAHIAIMSNMSQDEIVEMSTKAISHGHSTNRMAANNAKLLDCTNLIFTHFSNRYEYEDGKMKNETEIINDTVNILMVRYIVQMTCLHINFNIF